MPIFMIKKVIIIYNLFFELCLQQHMWLMICSHSFLFFKTFLFFIRITNKKQTLKQETSRENEVRKKNSRLQENQTPNHPLKNPNRSSYSNLWNRRLTLFQIYLKNPRTSGTWIPKIVIRHPQIIHLENLITTKEIKPEDGEDWMGYPIVERQYSRVY